MEKKYTVFAIALSLILSSWGALAQSSPFYVVTAVDAQHYPLVLNFIGAIHRVNFKELGEIAIFDLGLDQEQKDYLKTIAKVAVYPIEMTHPDLLTHVTVRPNGRQARGWYAWKPVAIKQALEMFPEILYIDSGILMLKPLNKLFEYIREHDYFLLTCGHSIAWMTTKYVKGLFNLGAAENGWILDSRTEGLSAGLQGLTRNMLNSYVLPIYELSKQMRPFVDDGTAPKGFGTGRHDQTLFSIQARLLHLGIFTHASRPGDYAIKNAPIREGVDFTFKGGNPPDFKVNIVFK